MEQFDGSVMKVDVHIPEDPDDIPDTPTGRVFRAAAQRLIHSLKINAPPRNRDIEARRAHERALKRFA